jgi:hypothetical protein
MDDAPKTLTLSEANALLPNIRPLLEQLQTLQTTIAESSRQLGKRAEHGAAGNGFSSAENKQRIQDGTKRQLQLIEAFQDILKRLEGVGCVIKDLSIGLVDFYSIRNGELVFLCWKLEEDQIRFWHALDTGYAGRRSLDEESGHQP